MKKFLASIIAVACIFTSMPTVGMAFSENSVSTDAAAKVDMELKGSSAPVLTIGKHSDHVEDLVFYLDLNNAEWLYSGKGNIDSGVGYEVITSKKLMITVNKNEFSPQSNDIKIPLKTMITDVGVATVTIDPKESTVAAGTYTFAHASFPGMAISIGGVDKEKGTFDVSFDDSYPYAMSSGKIFKLTLDNGYTFSSFQGIAGTGKYANKVEFAIESANSSVAYIKINGTVTNSVGTIKVSGIKTAASDRSEDKATNLFVEPLYGDGSGLSFSLESFSSDEVVKEGIPVVFTIGTKGYTVDDKEYEADVAPFIDESGRTMLPIRALANAFNISDNDISWNDTTKTVTLKNKEGKDVVITVGSTLLMVGDSKVTMDTTAVIKDGRTFLPMRAILNGLGIVDDDIIWDSTVKKVLVYNKQ